MSQRKIKKALMAFWGPKAKQMKKVRIGRKKFEERLTSVIGDYRILAGRSGIFK